MASESHRLTRLSTHVSPVTVSRTWQRGAERGVRVWASGGGEWWRRTRRWWQRIHGGEEGRGPGCVAYLEHLAVGTLAKRAFAQLDVAVEAG